MTTQTQDTTATTQPATETDTTASDCAAILRRRQALGLSRVNLATLAGLTGAKIWRIEDGRPKDGELAAVDRALTEVEENGLPAEMIRPTRAGRVSPAVQQLANTRELIRQALGAKTRRDADELLRRALEDPQPPADTEASDETQVVAEAVAV